jgi:hypothetical protein
MDALPLAGNLSLYELFRQLVPDTALGAVAVVLILGLFLSVVAIWLWSWRPDEHQGGGTSTFADTTESTVAHPDTSVVGLRANRRS